jgi:AbrB family looped-hinge helix DNA binding protein
LRIKRNWCILIEKKYNVFGGVDMHAATVSAKGWIVIPKVYREKYGLKSGRKVQVVDYGGGLSIVPIPEDPIEALRGMFADGPSLTKDLLEERQREREREEAQVERLRAG